MIHIRYLKDGDAFLPPPERRVEVTIDPTPAIGHPILKPSQRSLTEQISERHRQYVPGDDPVELAPVPACMLAQTGTVERTATWSRWDRAKWAAAFLLTGLALGAVICAVVNYFTTTI